MQTAAAAVATASFQHNEKNPTSKFYRIECHFNGNLYMEWTYFDRTDFQK